MGSSKAGSRASRVPMEPAVGIGHNGPMVSEPKHAASRRGPRMPPVLALAAAVTGAVVAWGYLVYLAIDFGTTARGGDERAWWLLGLASLGAVLCLFLGLVLVARLLRALGITQVPEEPAPAAPRAPGGRRASR